MQTDSQVDPVSLLIVVFTSILGAQFAPAATAYSIILMGGFVGLMIGVRRREPTSRLGTLAYSAVTLVTALFMTVFVSQLIGPHLSGGKGEWMYFPVSLMTTAFGEVWMDKLQGVTGMLFGLFSKEQK
jgi:hypothetical protein